MYTKLGADSSCRFPFSARRYRQADKQTYATDRLTHAVGYAGVGNNRAVCYSVIAHQTISMCNLCPGYVDIVQTRLHVAAYKYNLL